VCPRLLPLVVPALWPYCIMGMGQGMHAILFARMWPTNCELRAAPRIQRGPGAAASRWPLDPVIAVCVNTLLDCCAAPRFQYTEQGVLRTHSTRG
jgi:hypothetical protein